MKSISKAGTSVRLFGAKAKFWTGFWKATAVANWKMSVVTRVGPPSFPRFMRLLRKVPPNSIHPTVLRIKG